MPVGIWSRRGLRTTVMGIRFRLCWCLHFRDLGQLLSVMTLAARTPLGICHDSSFQIRACIGGAPDACCILKFELGFPTKNHRATARR